MCCIDWLNTPKFEILSVMQAGGPQSSLETGAALAAKESRLALFYKGAVAFEPIFRDVRIWAYV